MVQGEISLLSKIWADYEWWGAGPCGVLENHVRRFFYEEVDWFFRFYPAAQFADGLFCRGIGRGLFDKSPRWLERQGFSRIAV
jgi:hypothetical protein